eukprot:g7367.t1
MKPPPYTVFQQTQKFRLLTNSSRLKRCFQVCSFPDRSSKNTGSKISIDDSGSKVELVNLGLSLDSIQIHETTQFSNPKIGENSNWTDWLRYISQIDLILKQLQTLSKEVDLNAKLEQFSKAAQAQKKINLCQQHDMTIQIEQKLDDAIMEEDFKMAAKLRDEGLVGLNGWWIARSTDDPHGTLVCIHQSFSHYVGRAFTMSDLALANDKHQSELFMSLFTNREEAAYTLSSLVFEVYLKEDNNGDIVHQTCVLKTPTLPRPDRPIKSKEEKPHDDNKLVFDFNYVSSDDGIPTMNAKSSDQEASDQGDSNRVNTKEYLAMELQYRVRAKIHWWDRNRFVLTTEEEPDLSNLKRDNGRIEAIDRIMAQRSFMIFSNRASSADSTTTSFDTSFERVLNHVLDETHVQRLRYEEQELEEYDPYFDYGYYDPASSQDFIQLEDKTIFSRLPDDSSTNDPFTGYYIGRFGPHGLELIHLSRHKDKVSDHEFVQARKITGDPNVPSGEVTFWAYLGHQSTSSFVGHDQEDLGIRSIYNGKGKVAGSGYENPKWVDGQLLVFDSWSSLASNSELGFVWSVPNARKFLILLSRVRLPEY